MDDPRIEWIRDKVFLALDIAEGEVFDDMLNRDDGENEREIAKFLNETPEEHTAALLFYKIEREEEEEVEVECGMEDQVLRRLCCISFFDLWAIYYFNYINQLIYWGGGGGGCCWGCHHSHRYCH